MSKAAVLSDGHSRIMHVDEPPAVRHFSIYLRFPAARRYRRTILAKLGGEIPIELRHGSVAEHLHRDVVNAELPLGEHPAHQPRVHILFDLLESLFMPQRMNERGLRGIPPNLGGQGGIGVANRRSEEHTSELQSHSDLVCRLLLEKKNKR